MMSEKGKEEKNTVIKGANYHFPSLEDELRLARRRGELGDAVFTHMSPEEIAEIATEYDSRTPGEHTWGMREAARIINEAKAEKDDLKEE